MKRTYVKSRKGDKIEDNPRKKTKVTESDFSRSISPSVSPEQEENSRFLLRLLTERDRKDEEKVHQEKNSKNPLLKKR